MSSGGNDEEISLSRDQGERDGSPDPRRVRGRPILDLSCHGCCTDQCSCVPGKIGGEFTANMVSFFVFGLVNNFGYVIMLSAAEDLLETAQGGENLSPGAVLLADILPTLIIKMTAPFFMDKIPFAYRVIFSIGISIASFWIVALTPTVGLRLFGVCCASIGAGFGEITFLAMTSRYDKDTVSAWSAGTGGAGVFGALSYLALTTWFMLDHATSLLIVSVLPFSSLYCYLCVLHQTHHVHSSTESSEATPMIVSRSKRPQLPLARRIAVLKSLIVPYMGPLFLVYYSEYLINQGVAPVIRFENAPFEARAHYVYYQFLYQSGVFISRSSVNFFPIKRIWIPSFLQLLNLVFLIVHAMFDVIGYVWFVFAIIFYEGLLGGATYVNAFYLVSQEVPPEYREFALGVVSVADTFGIALAGMSAVFVDTALKNYRIANGMYV